MMSTPSDITYLCDDDLIRCDFDLWMTQIDDEPDERSETYFQIESLHHRQQFQQLRLRFDDGWNMLMKITH